MEVQLPRPFPWSLKSVDLTPPAATVPVTSRVCWPCAACRGTGYRAAWLPPSLPHCYRRSEVTAWTLQQPTLLFKSKWLKIRQRLSVCHLSHRQYHHTFTKYQNSCPHVFTPALWTICSASSFPETSSFPPSVNMDVSVNPGHRHTNLIPVLSMAGFIWYKSNKRHFNYAMEIVLCVHECVCISMCDVRIKRVSSG